MSLQRRARHRDPDISALVEASGGLFDARTLVIKQARDLNSDYKKWESGNSSPLDRLKQLASLRRLRVAPMEPHHNTQRDAVILMNGLGHRERGQIFYNPLRPLGRVLFSIAHEIAHTFFPSTVGGARFRELLEDDSQEQNELEQLCHVGAAELLMPVEEFCEIAQGDWSIRQIPLLTQKFGGSFEATLFRLATACPKIAIAGSAIYRRTKGDEAKLRAMSLEKQGDLFNFNLTDDTLSVSEPKYRRQSLHISESCPRDLVIHWNKSFDLGSCIYRISDEGLASAFESLPSVSGMVGVLEAVDAPYQRINSDPDHPDVLFFWKAA